MCSDREERKWILNCLKTNLENKIILRNKKYILEIKEKTVRGLNENLPEND